MPFFFSWLLLIVTWFPCMSEKYVEDYSQHQQDQAGHTIPREINQILLSRGKATSKVKEWPMLGLTIKRSIENLTLQIPTPVFFFTVLFESSDTAEIQHHSCKGVHAVELWLQTPKWMHLQLCPHAARGKCWSYWSSEQNHHRFQWCLNFTLVLKGSHFWLAKFQPFLIPRSSTANPSPPPTQLLWNSPSCS